MLVGNKEYLTPEELDRIYAETAEGVDVDAYVKMDKSAKIFSTDSFVVLDNNGVPQKITSRPNWYNEDGQLVSDEFLNSENYYNYFISSQPICDPYVEMVQESDLKEFFVDHENKNVIQVWKIVELSEQEKEEYVKNRWTQIREERDKYLIKSDWTQLPDVNLTDDKKGEWATYRQELRDVMTKYEDPRDFLFPRRPV
jgi:hypothetical protein